MYDDYAPKNVKQPQQNAAIMFIVLVTKQDTYIDSNKPRLNSLIPQQTIESFFWMHKKHIAVMIP
jgi:hypothetical protein